MRVRLAGPDDFDGIFDLRTGLHAENALQDALGNRVPISEDKIRHMVMRALVPVEDRYPAWIGVIGSHDLIEAAVYLGVEQPWYSDALMLVERFVYIRPEYRQSTHFQDLIAWSKLQSDKSGIRPLIMGVITADREAAKCRLYRRHLGDPAGSTFLYTGRGI